MKEVVELVVMSDIFIITNNIKNILLNSCWGVVIKCPSFEVRSVYFQRQVYIAINGELICASVYSAVWSLSAY